MKLIVLAILACLVNPVYAQPRPDLTPDQAEQLRNQQRHPDQRQWNRQDRYPRWCRGYDYMDYRRELRHCGPDRSCRSQVRRKADICGMR